MGNNNNPQTPPPENPQKPQPVNHQLNLQPLTGVADGLPTPGLTPSNGVVLPGHTSSQAQEFTNSNDKDVDTILDGHRLFLAGTTIPNPELTTIPWPGAIAGLTLADKARMHHDIQIPFDYDATINPQQLIREQQPEHDRPTSDASDSQLENRACVEENRPAEANAPLECDPPTKCTFKAPEIFNQHTPNEIPETLFTEKDSTQVGRQFNGRRYVRRNNNLQLLLRAESVSCWAGTSVKYSTRTTSLKTPKAGYAFAWSEGATITHRVETKGPTGKSLKFVRNKKRWGELRAVLAALTYFHWDQEGWTELVICTSSEYVVENATEKAPAWIQNDQLEFPNDVEHSEMWEALLKEIAGLSNRKVCVYFWLVSKIANRAILAAAENVAREGEAVYQWTPLKGVPS